MSDEPFLIQRSLCRRIRDSFYADGGRQLFVLPFNRHIAADSGSPGWVWLTPTRDTAAHPFGKFVVRLEEDRFLCVGYAVEKGYGPAIAGVYGCKPFDGTWAWWKVMADIESGAFLAAATAARHDFGELTLIIAIAPPDRLDHTHTTMALAEDGSLTPTNAIPGIKPSPDTASWTDLRTLARWLQKVGDDTYVDLQWVQVFDFEDDPDPLMTPQHLYTRLLRHFEPWVFTGPAR